MRKPKLKQPWITTAKTKRTVAILPRSLGNVVTVSVSARGRILKEMFPGVDEKYLEQTFKKIEANGCPNGEDLMEWFGKLVVAEILADSLHPAKDNKKENKNEND